MTQRQLQSGWWHKGLDNNHRKDRGASHIGGCKGHPEGARSGEAKRGGKAAKQLTPLWLGSWVIRAVRRTGVCVSKPGVSAMPIGLRIERSERLNASHPLMPFHSFSPVAGALATRKGVNMLVKLGKFISYTRVYGSRFCRFQPYIRVYGFAFSQVGEVCCIYERSECDAGVFQWGSRHENEGPTGIYR